MSDSLVFGIGLFIAILCAIFLYITVWGITHPTETGSIQPPPRSPDISPVSGHPLRILFATDGSPCSDRALQSVAVRPWPAGSEIEVVSVAYTHIPLVPEPTLTGAAGYVDALNLERADAPVRAKRAEEYLRAQTVMPVTTRVLEGNPGKAIVEEAERWQADLVIVGSHGYGSVKRALLGSVSQHLALHAHCSVEIMRCPHNPA